MLKKFDQRLTEGILFLDQYELVMAQLYFKEGLHEKNVQFDHFFRSYPHYGLHQAGYCINAGLEWFIDWMDNSYFTDKEIDFLRNHKNDKGKRVFDDDFLKWLKSNGNFSSLSISAIPEGRVVHPNTPLTVVKGPLPMAQIIETALLNQLNFQILIATKASRIKEAARNKLLLEFGARRAQDRGAIAGVRAAIIGGADSSSNMGISYLLGKTPQGTHAHSLVQLYLALGMTEEDAFTVFSEHYPDNCILLVDTINTLESGLPNAIKIFEKMKKKGHKPIGIRLDSGDLAYLSIQSAKMMNEAGFTDTKIVLSNELDELNIWQIITQISEEAPKAGLDADDIIDRLIFGVGTRLITSAGDSALGGVFKLTAVENKGEWIPAIKISEVIEKIPNPGDKQVLRIYDSNNKATADLVSLKEENINEQGEIKLQHPETETKYRVLEKDKISRIEPLLVDVTKNGKKVYDFPSIDEIKKARKDDLEKLDTGVKRLINPHLYHVSLTNKLMKLKKDLLDKMRK